jgi:hypothetical protein
MMARLAMALGSFLAAVFITMAQSAAATTAANKSHTEQIELFTQWWVGSFSNERQTNADRLLNEPGYPESVRLLRDMRVYRVNAPAVGDLVLFLQEIKSDLPGKAHRQRVMTFRWNEERRQIEVEQLFFSPELLYDQHFIPVADIEKMKRADFIRQQGCDLFFSWDAEKQRFKGGMLPRKCEYRHPTSGMVYAEFDMILDRDRLWYRDRSIKLVDGSIRGEVDGFSWLRFDRLASIPELGGNDRISRAELVRRAPLLARMEGVWEGVFRRYDAAGELTETLPSRVEVRFLPDGQALDYGQVNIYRREGQADERIETFGKWDVDRLRFSNARLEGWAQDVAADPTGLSSVFSMTFKDGSGLTVSEIVTLSADGIKRSRATQYLVNGTIVRRTLIDEAKVN